MSLDGNTTGGLFRRYWTWFTIRSACMQRQLEHCAGLRYYVFNMKFEETSTREMEDDECVVSRQSEEEGGVVEEESSSVISQSSSLIVAVTLNLIPAQVWRGRRVHMTYPHHQYTCRKHV
jgi:hypothetical protein